MSRLLRSLRLPYRFDVDFRCDLSDGEVAIGFTSAGVSMMPFTRYDVSRRAWIDLTDVEHVVLTGVGSAYIEKPVYGLPTSRADEFVADGLGARFESKLDHIIVVSMGTGTSLVLCNGSDIHHIGGISIGGGTLQGLSRIMLQTSDIRQVSELAKHGDISHVSLMIGDISAHPLPGLPMNVTASLFANAQTDASKEDIAVGLIHTVLQSVGSAAVLSALNTDIKNFVLIGNLSLLPQCKDVFPMMEQLYNVRFHIPKYSEFCTAIGAALDYIYKKG